MYSLTVPAVRILRFVPTFGAPVPALEGGNVVVLVSVDPAGPPAPTASVIDLTTGTPISLGAGTAGDPV
jgi:hypothetical protein